MLKALELLGFKSFADKTRFEFPSGITTVVGPNGSGKSNVVDAIKWVLGEQSVKSLRGKEMADVIFNGSGSRRPMNSAEITLTFDNSNNLLPIDTPEVHITRRVYRSGEGEYLINRHPARLRDIRDLLSGTGLGSQAYSVIEQGKVDVLLQSSARERRLIFEEAAGISRFKTKKLEALRRLERVDQNLLRLSDIVDEVENRLRSVRTQAGKARRYKEYTDRLQELRTQVGLVDWRRLSDRLGQFEDELQSLAEGRDAATAEAEAAEAQLLRIETESGDVNEEIRQSEARNAANRERIAGFESTIEHERAHDRDLQEEIDRLRRHSVDLTTRAGDLRQQLESTAESVQQAEEHHREVSRTLVERERELTGVMSRLDQIRGESEQRRAAYLEQMRRSATLGNQCSALESEVSAAAASRDRSQRRIAELDERIDALRREIEELRRQQEEASELVDSRQMQLDAAKDQLHRLRQQLATCQDNLAELRQRHRGTSERAAVLEELQRRQEGVSAGVKEVLAASRDGQASPYRNVHGLLADLLNVSVEVAPLVEAALGPVAQHVVATRHTELLRHLEEESPKLAGRVGFLWLGGDGGVPAAELVDLEGRAGVLGRADRFVETEPEYAHLARELLADTWIVEKLSHAVGLAESLPGRLSFVTLAGELLRADGTLVVGPRDGAVGLISRRSQLRALKTQLEELQAEIQQTEQAAQTLAQQTKAQQGEVDAHASQHREAVDALAEQRFQIKAAEQRGVQLDQQREVLAAELRAADTQHETASQQLAETRQQREQLESGLIELESRLAALDEQIGQLDDQRQAHDRETTQIKVDLAKSEERLRNLHARMRQFEDTRQERVRAIDDAREQLTQCQRRAEASQWNILNAESQIAELYLRKEQFATQTVELINHRELLREQRAELTAQTQKIRNRIRRVEEKIHTQDLAANEIRHERNSLADRLREDYGIELAELEHEPTGEEEQHQRDEVQTEIDELRRKINNLGNVNLEALEELEQLDGRHETLAAQYNDLTTAKNDLERTIEKINVDSRRLFAETLETVKGHFQTLFRDLFGGGHGDIILDEGVDILESGIEIVARPPGKEPRSISLLSGGEKTLTCVALLLAIFRSRPSPFCVLDEVDAALDEANIDRFTQVLQDFLTWTQFVIVTHSKKTMTCANTIYGVTMQESGVSKQVSVRFEDVSEDGHILQRRLDEEDDETQAA